VFLIEAVICLHVAPRVLLFPSAGNGWPQNAPRYHQLMPISRHFRDYKSASGHLCCRVSCSISSSGATSGHQKTINERRISSACSLHCCEHDDTSCQYNYTASFQSLTRKSCSVHSPVRSIGHARSCRRRVATWWKEQTRRSQNCKYLP